MKLTKIMIYLMVTACVVALFLSCDGLPVNTRRRSNTSNTNISIQQLPSTAPSSCLIVYQEKRMQLQQSKDAGLEPTSGERQDTTETDIYGAVITDSTPVSTTPKDENKPRFNDTNNYGLPAEKITRKITMILLCSGALILLLAPFAARALMIPPAQFMPGIPF